MRLVLDTNCLVSALIFRRGRIGWLRGAWQDGRIQPLLSKPTAAELLRVLAYPKFRITPVERHDLLADILPFAETVILPVPALRTPSLRDPDDRIFLETALAGGADALVTGDGDLLALAEVFPVPIITPAELLARLEPRA